MTRSTILFITETDDVLASLTPMLRRDGFQVAYARSVDGAIAQIQRHRPDFVIAELNASSEEGTEGHQRWWRACRRDTVCVFLVDTTDRLTLMELATMSPIAIERVPPDPTKLFALIEGYLGKGFGSRAWDGDCARVLLVAGDAQSTRALVCRMCPNGRCSYDITAVASLEEAEHQVRHHVFDAVLIGERLPDGTGADLFVSAEEHLLDTAVLIWSTEEHPAAALRAFQRGRVDVLGLDDVSSGCRLRRRIDEAIAKVRSRRDGTNRGRSAA